MPSMYTQRFQFGLHRNFHLVKCWKLILEKFLGKFEIYGKENFSIIVLTTNREILKLYNEILDKFKI